MSDKKKQREQERLAEKRAAEEKAAEEKALAQPAPAGRTPESSFAVEQRDLVDRLKVDAERRGAEALMPGGIGRAQAAMASAQEIDAALKQHIREGGVLTDDTGRPTIPVRFDPESLGGGGGGTVVFAPAEPKPDVEEALRQKSFEAGVWEGRSEALTEQLKELDSRLRPLANQDEAPVETLERIIALASTLKDMLSEAKGHGALLAVAQVAVGPERYDVVLVEKLPDGKIGTTVGVKGKVWSEAREALSRLLSTRVTPEPFRE